MSADAGLNPNVIWRVVDGETILLDTSTGYHFSFDPMGTEIWQSLQAGDSVNDIVARIAREYSTDESIVRADVDEFVKELRSAKLWT